MPKNQKIKNRKSNGYGGQYFHISKIKKDSSEKQVSIASGPVVNIIGTQTGVSEVSILP